MEEVRVDIASTGSAQWIVDFKELRGAMVRVVTAAECRVTFPSSSSPWVGGRCASVFHMEKLRSQKTQ